MVEVDEGGQAEGHAFEVRAVMGACDAPTVGNTAVRQLAVLGALCACCGRILQVVDR